MNGSWLVNNAKFRTNLAPWGRVGVFFALLLKLLIVAFLVVTGLVVWMYYQEHGDLIFVDKEKTEAFLFKKSEGVKEQLRGSSEFIREKAHQAVEKGGEALAGAGDVLVRQKADLEVWFSRQKTKLLTRAELSEKANKYYAWFQENDEQDAVAKAPVEDSAQRRKAAKRRRLAEKREREKAARETEQKRKAQKWLTGLERKEQTAAEASAARAESNGTGAAPTEDEAPSVAATREKPAETEVAAASGIEPVGKSEPPPAAPDPAPAIEPAEPAPTQPVPVPVVSKPSTPEPAVKQPTKRPKPRARGRREDRYLRQGREAFRKGVEHWRAAGAPNSPKEQKELAIALRHLTEARRLLGKAARKAPDDLKLQELQVDCNRFLYDCNKRTIVNMRR